MAGAQWRVLEGRAGGPLNPVFRVDKTESREPQFGERAFYFSRAIHNPTP